MFSPSFVFSITINSLTKLTAMDLLLNIDIVQLLTCLLLLVGIVEWRLPASSSIKGKMKFLVFILAVLCTIINLITYTSS